MPEWITFPLQYEFFRHAMVAAVLVGGMCGLIGVYITLRGMSYIGHGLSHAAFGGAVVGYVMHLNFYIGAGLWGFLAALLINAVTRRRGIGADAAIGIVTTASFAVGVALISRVRQFSRNLEAALFGNILGVTVQDLIVIVGVTVLTATVIFLLYKPLLFTTFDREAARVFGVRTERVDAIFSLILAAVIIGSMQVIGVTLIAAAIVTPAVTARLITHRFHRLFFTATAIGALTGVVGMYLSFYLDAASGATIVLFAAALFMGVMVLTARRRALPAATTEAEVSPAVAAPQRDDGHVHEHLHEEVAPDHSHVHPFDDVHHDHDHARRQDQAVPPRPVDRRS